MSGEFINMLVAGILIFILIYVFAVPGVLPAIGSPSGKFLAQDRLMHTVLAEDKWVSSSLFSVARTEGAVTDEFNGDEKGLLLPFSNDPKWFERALVEMTVKKSGSGNLVMTINGEKIYDEAAKPGMQYIYFDKDMLTGEDVLEIKASRGAAFWASADYDVKAEIKGETFSNINTTFLTPQKYSRAKLIVSFGQTEGKLSIRLNDQMIFDGEPDGLLNLGLTNLKKANTIEFTAETGTKHLVDWAEIRFE